MNIEMQWRIEKMTISITIGHIVRVVGEADVLFLKPRLGGENVVEKLKGWKRRRPNFLDCLNLRFPLRSYETTAELN